MYIPFCLLVDFERSDVKIFKKPTNYTRKLAELSEVTNTMSSKDLKETLGFEGVREAPGC